MSPGKDSTARPYVNPYLGGLLLGLVLFGAYAVTGAGLGASGAITRLQLFFVDLVASHHVDTNAYWAAKAGGDRSPLLNPGVFMLLGVILGGALSGIANRRFKLELRRGPSISVATRVAMALTGGVLMGVGARLARGCTSGQALSGGAVLSIGSFVFMFAIFGAAYALAYFVRKLWN